LEREVEFAQSQDCDVREFLGRAWEGLPIGNPEESVFMVGIPKSEAQELGRAFGHIAIVTKDQKIWVLGMNLS
jgi:hypothetical protein